MAGAEIVQDAVAFFQAFEGMEEGFRTRASAVRELLADPATAYVLVTSARPDAVDEATFFAEKLAERDVAVAALVVNRIAPVASGTAAAEPPPGSADGRPWPRSRRTWPSSNAVAAREEAAFAGLAAQVAPAPVGPDPALRAGRARAGRTAARGRPRSSADAAPAGTRLPAATGRSDSLRSVQTILVASDAPTLRREIEAVISGPDVEVRAVTSGPEVVAFVAEESPDLRHRRHADGQHGRHGGAAWSCASQESYDAIDHIPVLMLLDRRPDVFLARRSGAEGWLVKPLDPLRLRRAVAALLDDGTYADDSFTPVPVLVGAGPQLEAGPEPRA